MWSEDINKKIREAGDSDNFPFDETSWENMEVLLDKHLPQKKKRRGLFILLLSLSLLSIPAIMLIRQEGIKKTEIITSTTANNKVPVDEPDKSNENASTENAIEIKESPVTIVPVTKETDKPISNQPAADMDLIAVKGIHQVPVKKSKSEPAMQNYSSPISNYSGKNVASPVTVNKDKNKRDIIAASPSTAGIESVAKEDIITSSTKTIGKTDSAKNNSAMADNKVVSPVDTIALVKASDKKKSSSSSIPRKFGITFSIGPDISSVIKNNAGKVEAKYGLGLSYQPSKKFLIRTGFFVSRKVYSADSAAYHPDPVFWTYYSNLQKVDANCLVFEIPVSLSYTIFSKRKNSAFVSTGLSSYFMKKETYDYSYKDTWGAPTNHVSVYNNENKHLFSVLNLSAGLRHQFNDRLSLIAEPYTQLPIKGVGAGKVKLNSAGILFTIDYKPFGKK